MNEADRDVFEEFLEKAGGAIELFMCNSVELMALSFYAENDKKVYAVCHSAGAIIKQIYDGSNPAPRCLLCNRRFRPNDRQCPGRIVSLVPWAAVNCALSAGICKPCCDDEATLEERVKAQISGMVPGSRFVVVEQTEGKIQ
jgi:hypothetical protein